MKCIPIPAFILAAGKHWRTTVIGVLSWGEVGVQYYHLPNWQAALHDPSCIMFTLLGFLGIIAKDGTVVDNPLVGQVINSGAIGSLVAQVMQTKPGVAK